MRLFRQLLGARNIISAFRECARNAVEPRAAFIRAGKKPDAQIRFMAIIGDRIK